ncbi:MAG: toll/interleukin-1 receptor domain-containing protein, partial [Micrococcales bacterium]|nr:toll/interleukin-1 receptor domain-containing protein [Micrococcales bacterium]
MADTTPPKVFMSYSHDSDDHRAWVVRLATYLRGNGIDVCLDQWDLTLGANLMAYMERAADTEYRVVVVVTSSYVSKADSRDGGTGYEAQMLSASMLRDLNGDRVVPLLRNNPQGTMPAFLEGRLWIDFRDDSQFEPKYEELLRELHGRRLDSAPPIGPNPLDGKTEYESRLEIRNNPARWSAPAESGSVQFVYNQNNGRCTLGH